MLLDNRTLLFSLSLICVMMAFSLAVASWGKERDGLKKWSGAIALEALAWPLLGLRGLIPDVLAVGLSGLLLVSAQAVKLAAIHEFRRIEWSRLQYLLPITAVLLALAFIPYEDNRMRMVFGSMIFLTQMILILRALHGDAESRAGRAWWLLFGATAVIVPLFILRGIAAYFGAIQFATPQSTIAPNPVQLALFVGMISMSMLGSMGFILMVKERADRAIRALAMVDSLTGVFNRRAFMERADKEAAIAWRSKMPLALIMLDIDHFKRINDEHGHPVGDVVLTEVAHLLASRLRKQDTLGRYGGEEFCILLPATGVEGAAALAEGLRAAVESAVPPQGCEELRITISLGVAVYPASCECEFQELIDRADAALYQAKRAGRNRVVMAGPECAEGLEPAPA